ncbi:DUF5715 family protein [uncultured Porphyromonas sp.]|uniref:DUF5715 family protein n=1 Tax=uncultured Porphyromonas sp. TaxID=159274 RepID=UPI002633F94A|nr:DUF5715 family protein [uncultured Porphyromonas sp.]
MEQDNNSSPDESLLKQGKTRADLCLEEIIRSRTSSPRTKERTERSAGTVVRSADKGSRFFLARLWSRLIVFLRSVSKPVVTHYYLPLLAMTLLATLLISLTPPTEPPAPAPDTGSYSVVPGERPYRYIGSFRRDFDDLNPVQLEAAQSLGITPAECRDDLLRTDRLVPLKETPALKLDDLTHSVPLMVPEAVRLAQEIGAAFRYQLEVDGQPLYRPIVTSVTRTAEDMDKLRQRNGNASLNSTHCYGTTLDISWQRYDKVDPEDPRTIEPEELKHLLARVLRAFHEDGRCYVKHERRQACFHITVREK